MNALVLLAQVFFDHQARRQAENLKEAGRRAAETGRRMAIAGVFFATAGIFGFSALLLAVIDFGLQIDRDQSIHFSGLMVSSLLLILIGAFAAACGWFVGRESTDHHAHAPANEEPSSSEIRPLLEAVAVSLLKEFLANRNAQSASAPDAKPTAASQDERTSS